MRAWRNWFTRTLEGRMAARPWEFESPRAHKMSENYFQGNKNHPQHVSEKIGQLKMRASDGKFYLTDVADTEGIFRIIQSIPSPKAEPFKLWLARVGYERVEEAEDPEKAIQRAMVMYLKKGYSKNWVDLRLKSIEIRKALTDGASFDMNRIAVRK